MPLPGDPFHGPSKINQSKKIMSGSFITIIIIGQSLQLLFICKKRWMYKKRLIQTPKLPPGLVKRLIAHRVRIGFWTCCTIYDSLQNPRVCYTTHPFYDSWTPSPPLLAIVLSYSGGYRTRRLPCALIWSTAPSLLCISMSTSRHPSHAPTRSLAGIKQSGSSFARAPTHVTRRLVRSHCQEEIGWKFKI